MSLMIESKKKVVRKSNSQKHSRRKAQDSDALEEKFVPSGVTYTTGGSVPSNADLLQKGRRPNRSVPIHDADEIEGLLPVGDDLKAMSEKYPAPAEWSDEH